MKSEELHLEFFPAEKESHSTLLIIPSAAFSRAGNHQFAQVLSKEFQVLLVEGYLYQSSIGIDNLFVISFTKHLASALKRQGVKRVTVFGFGEGSSVAQALAFLFPQIVRRVVLLDGTTRVAPGLLSRIVDGLERFLPVGLPLRKLSPDFDSRPSLHRITCPALVMTSPDAPSYVVEQSQYIADKIPNAWFTELKTTVFREGFFLKESELIEIIQEFLQVPVKRPQKRNRSGFR